MLNDTLRAGAVGAGAASRYGSGSGEMMRLLAAPAPAPQHCPQRILKNKENCIESLSCGCPSSAESIYLEEFAM
jgi:hypothetical protein